MTSKDWEPAVPEWKPAEEVPRVRKPGKWREVLLRFLDSGLDTAYLQASNRLDMEVWASGLRGNVKAFDLPVRIEQRKHELRVYATRLKKEKKEATE